MTKPEWFDLGPCDVDRYEGKNGDDANAAEEEEPSQADDESMPNIEDSGHSRFALQTSNIAGYEGEDANYADEEEEDASQTDDGSTQNVKD